MSDLPVLEAVNNVARGGDPEFVGSLPRIKPADIPDLNPLDGSSWINEIKAPIGVTIEALPTHGWTTVDEERLFSNTDGQSKKFVLNLRVRSLLVSPELTDKPENWPRVEDWLDIIPYLYPEENLTLNTAQARLLDARNANPEISGDVVPLVAAHTNRHMFQGFRRLAFLHPLWLKKYALLFDGCEIKLNGQSVARFEEWQEGYEDESYSRELLSAGARLVVRNDWLRTVLRESNLALVLRNHEDRRELDGIIEERTKAEARRITYRVLLH